MDYKNSEYDFYEKLNSDSLYAATGFLMLEDADYNYWYYYRKEQMLIPYEYGRILLPCKTAADFSENNRIKINGDWYPYTFPDPENAREFFTSLNQLSVFEEYKIEGRIWMLSDNELVYDGYTKNVIPGKSVYNQKDRIFPLQCVYLDAPVTGDAVQDWQNTCLSWKKLNLCPASMRKEFDKEFDTILKPAAVPEDPKSGNRPQASPAAQPVRHSTRKSQTLSEQTARLLDCDKRRCRLASYGESILYDHTCGHWDLFGQSAAFEYSGAKQMIPRDPRADIREGIVGIDFGTKSTVVVCQNGTSLIVPVPIGSTDFLSAENHMTSRYESPVVIECADLDIFLKKYQEKPGRPETSCEDVSISHEAYCHYISCPPEEFYAYYTDLKKWADLPQKEVSVMDKQGHRYLLGADTSEEMRTVNPLELYAYYMGMYLNNMQNGIYMKYLMSFPVEYSRETKQLILDSFEKGIKKSLPSCLLEDDTCMKDFYVRPGISEPAACAVTALEMSPLDPQNEKEKYMYGVFDFGGGTTNFAFGIWRGASENEYEKEGYNYVLECFGSGADSSLGGEQILELLAYTVFQNN